MHPGEKASYADEDAFAAAIRRDQPDRWFDPLAQGMVIDRNLYWPGAGGRLFLYGVPWRARGRELADLAALQDTTGFERDGLILDPGLSDLGAGRWALPVESDLYARGFGPRSPVATGE
jgi:hypothetical protein